MERVSLRALIRIDAGLEGAWSETVQEIWRPGDKGADLARLPSHDTFVPAVELIFPQHWVGLRCARRARGRNFFDRRMVRKILQQVERRLADHA